jgi:hypothetical protein
VSANLYLSQADRSRPSQAAKSQLSFLKALTSFARIAGFIAG